MHDAIAELDKHGLRKFGFVTGAIVAALFGLALPWLFDHGYPLWPWIVAGALFLWALVLPDSLKPVYRTWMRIGSVLGWINTRIILGILYFFVFVPIGILLRLLRQDAMARKFDPDQHSYRVSSRKRDKKTMERPF